MPELVGAGVFGWSRSRRNFHPASAPTPSLQYLKYYVFTGNKYDHDDNDDYDNDDYDNDDYDNDDYDYDDYDYDDYEYDDYDYDSDYDYDYG